MGLHQQKLEEEASAELPTSAKLALERKPSDVKKAPVEEKKEEPDPKQKKFGDKFLNFLLDD